MMAHSVPQLESELRAWLAERVRDPYALWAIDPEDARAILQIWCAGKERGFPALRVEYRIFKNEPPRAVYEIPAGASAWYEWLLAHTDSIALDAAYRTLYPPKLIRGGDSGAR